jgi:predicted metal-dependent hydrolase
MFILFMPRINNKRRTLAGGERFKLGGVDVEVVRKPIKHLYLRVTTPDGPVRVSAPRRMSDASIRQFVSRRLGWIRRHRAGLQRQVRASSLRFTDGERHYVWGESRVLRLEERAGRPFVKLDAHGLLMRVRPGTDGAGREALLDDWYRAQMRAELPALLDKWQQRLGVQARRVSLRQMKSRWGSCTPHTGDIRLNTSLAKWPIECLEYVLVHELVHLIEPSHNQRFKRLMDRHFPDWRRLRPLLNRATPAAAAE